MKRLLSLLLVCSLALPFPALGVEWTGESYEEKVAVLRQAEIYAIEATLDTDLCSVFLYRRIGTPRVQYNQIKIIYKPGSPQGDGATAGVTFREEEKLSGLTTSPDIIELSEDKKSFTYTNFDPDIGTDYYTVDLATGVATVKRVPYPGTACGLVFGAGVGGGKSAGGATGYCGSVQWHEEAG